MIKYFDHQGHRVVRVLRGMIVSVFEHLDITTWKVIDQMWMCVDQVLDGPALTKFRNTVLICKKLVKDEYEDHWGLG